MSDRLPFSLVPPDNTDVQPTQSQWPLGLNDLMNAFRSQVGQQSGPTMADAAQWHGHNLSDTWQAIQNPQTWVDAARQYGNALLMGTTAPKGVVAYHGSPYAFEAFDPSKVGSESMADRWAKGVAHKDEYYLTTSPEHAQSYGTNVHQYQIDAPLLQKDAKADLEAWAKDQGYDNAQQHIDQYYDGSAYAALDADNYFKDALREAKDAGFPGAQVSFGNLTTSSGSRKVPVGDVIVLHDPSVAVKAGAR